MLLGANAEGEEELALLEADAMADQAEHARRAQRVVAALGGELAAIGERLRFADDERAGHDVAEAAAERVDE